MDINQKAPLQFAREYLRRAAGQQYSEPELTEDRGIPEQGYHRIRKAGGFQIAASTIDGWMYGVIDLAKEFAHGKSEDQIKECRISPYLKKRGIKFNIPLDARTPSYSDASDSAARNIRNMWDFGFWKEFIDQMALEKYNVLSLWNLSPFPSMVRIPEYPETALEDVKMPTHPIKATLEGERMYAEDLEETLVTVKRMTIDEKISFWRRVMEYASERCVQIMIFTWNLFVFGTEHSPYGITDDQSNPITRDYVYCGVKELMKTYPLLAGIGVTAGEHMRRDETDISFIADTYGRAIREVLEEQPNRDFRLIHRIQYTCYDSIMQEFSDFPCPFEISFKYSQAHMFSSTKPSFIRGFLKEKNPDLKIWLTVRNDDYYMHRWGNPEFAREYLKNMPAEFMEGYYLGADGFTWGRDYMDRKNSRHPLFIQKMWYFFSVWGQLSYDPELSEEYFKSEVKRRLRLLDSEILYETWKKVSDIIPMVNCTHWHDFDFQWYPEGCCMYHPEEDKLVFADILEFINCGSIPEDCYMSVSEFCNEEGKMLKKITPVQQAEELWKAAEQGELGVTRIRRNGDAEGELKEILLDILALSQLGYYYSEKINAAVLLCGYQRTKKEEERQRALKYLENAKKHWNNYADMVSDRYFSQVLTRMGTQPVELQRWKEKAEQDILLAREI